MTVPLTVEGSVTQRRAGVTVPLTVEVSVTQQRAGVTVPLIVEGSVAQRGARVTVPLTVEGSVTQSILYWYWSEEIPSLIQGRKAAFIRGCSLITFVVDETIDTIEQNSSRTSQNPHVALARLLIHHRGYVRCPVKNSDHRNYTECSKTCVHAFLIWNCIHNSLLWHSS